MLKGTATKYGTGIQISGDYYDFENLYAVLYETANGMDEDDPESKLILNLAYEVRKANELCRETIELGRDQYDKVTYRSFKFHWTHYLVTVNLLRLNIGHLRLNLNQQAVIYSLEAIGVAALKSFDKAIGEKLALWITHYRICFDPLVFLMVERVTLDYLQEPDGKPRFKSLLEKMKIFGLFSKEYAAFKREVELNAKEHGIPPEQLTIPNEAFNQLESKWKW
jgi:hypothetical protein